MYNKIIGDHKYDNAEIEFKGQHNTFICNGNLVLKDCKIRFTGNNSLIYVDENVEPISLDMRVGNDSVIYIGKECYTNRTSHLYATERKNIIIGNQALLSFDSYFRTADPHLIYDCDSKARLNFSKSILIGDKVWIGQQAFILKGTVIGSGSIIGGRAVVSNKKIASNSLYAGNPAKKIKEHVFWASPKSTHDFDEEQEFRSRIYDGGNKYIYRDDEATTSLRDIDLELRMARTTSEKVKVLEKKLVNNNNKNRFYIK